MHFRLVGAPTATPVTVEEIRARGRVDAALTDATVEAIIKTATARYDGYRGQLGLALMKQTWELTTGPCFGRSIRVPIGPVIRVVSISYADEAGGSVTVPDEGYVLQADSLGWKVALLPAFDWPAVPSFEWEGLKVSVEVGHAAAAEVPAPIREAITLFAQHMLDTASGAGLIRTETVEKVGSTGYFTPDEASAPIIKLADDLVAPFRVMDL